MSGFSDADPEPVPLPEADPWIDAESDQDDQHTARQTGQSSTSSVMRTNFNGVEFHLDMHIFQSLPDNWLANSDDEDEESVSKAQQSSAQVFG